MSIILKNSSFGLIRTNPVLTTNIKIVTDGDKVYLESIDADQVLSNSKYKKFEVTGGLYSTDLFKFYSQNNKLLPKDIAYKVYERDDYVTVKDSFSKQYDFTYTMGTEYKNSRLYKEEYCTFAPLWVEPSNVPDYFVIFKLRGPLSINTDNTSDQNISAELESAITNPANLFNNYIKDAVIVKTFDLTKRTALGRYIRDHAENNLFPKYPVLGSIKKDDESAWEGISYENGGFCKKTKSIYKDYTIVDKTILEKDSYITNGFYDQGIVIANILNLEYLFDDVTDSDYEFNRYFGLYVSESELGKFEIDNPSTYSYSISSLDQIQEDKLITNDTGVVVAINLTTGSEKVPFNNTAAKIPYIKDTNNKFYSVNQSENYESIIGGNFIKLKNKSINLSDFYDYGVPFKYVDVFMNDITSASNFSFKVTGTPSLGDQIRIKYVSYTEDITKLYTVTAADLPNGTSEGTGFSINGSIYDIAKSITGAINYIELETGKTQQFTAIYINNRVVVYTRTKNSYLNRIKYTIFSTADTFPFTIPNQFGTFQTVYDYIDYPGSTNYLVGNLFSYHFTGGTDNPLSKFFIKQEDLYEIQDTEDPVFIKNFIKTTSGFKEITDYAAYLEEPIKNTKGEIIGFNKIDDYFTCYVDDAEVSIGVSKKLSLYHVQKNTNGYLSIFPVKDFDFDLYSTEYSKSADSDIERLKNWYAGSNSYLYGVTGSTGSTGVINTWYSSEFVLNGGFKTLTGLTDENGNIISNINSEYDRLKENWLSDLSIDSRVVPYVNKWVYDNDSRDVRENNYRLNTDQSFSYSNFSPSFTALNSDPSLFTHEWYYLQKYPSYFNFSDKLNSFSYFDDEINVNSLYDINSDYFLSYFTRESIGATSIPRDFRYSIFEYSSDAAYPETLFRGVKVIIKDRFEYSHLDNNINSKKFVINQSYDDYKFSAILGFGEIGTNIEVIKNEKYKNITLLIKAALDDPFLWNKAVGGTVSYRFIDRAHLYTLKNNYKVDSNGISVIDKNLSGVVQSWDFVNDGITDLVQVKLVKDQDGRHPNLMNEMAFGENGFYNDIVIIAPDGWIGNLKYIRFSNVTKCTLDTFWCQNIYYDKNFDGSTETLLDHNRSEGVDDTRLYFWDINYDGTPSALPNIDRIPTVFLYGGTHPMIKQRIKNLILTENLIYVNGGYNGLENIMREISFASIAEKINTGDPEITYTTVYSDGTTASDTFCLEFIKPVDEMTSSYLTVSDITRDTSYLQNFTGILGYKLDPMQRTIIHPVSRQKGGYSPKFKDLIQFIDYPTQGDPFYENTRIYTGITGISNSYGIIKNLNYNKVNVENSNNILKLKNSNTIYPYIGEIAIDKKDMFIFKSTFDPLYYTQHSTSVKSSTVSGLIETKESKSFFGSKVLSTPYSVRISNFEGLVDKTVLGNTNIYSTDYTVVKNYTDFGSSNQLMLDIYVDKLLINYFMKDGISSDFYKYFNQSYISEKTMDDFIKKYIKDNILDKYIIKGITFWEKFYPKGSTYNEVEAGLTDQEKISAGYLNTKNFAVTHKSDLNINLKYNIPVDKNYSISFTIELEKK